MSLSDKQIRDIFLANGFTVKPGHDDLRPYVYEAARALLTAARIERAQKLASPPVSQPAVADEPAPLLAKNFPVASEAKRAAAHRLAWFDQMSAERASPAVAQPAAVAPTANLKPDGAVRRFYINPESGHVVESERGTWVRYVDHCAALSAAPSPVAQEPGSINALLAEHARLLEHNAYCYFELAYTRSTGWMAWITDKPLCGPVVNPDRTVLANGQGGTPEEACRDALTAILAGQPSTQHQDAGQAGQGGAGV